MRKSMTTMMMMSMLGCAACSSDSASNEAADVSANDTVPMPVYSFLDTYDLSGKNVMVFTTYEGSGLADAISVIRQQEPQANVNATGFQTRGEVPAVTPMPSTSG